MAISSRPAAVLFDAYGTLLELDDPVGRLQAGLAEGGYVHRPEEVAAAFHAEVAHYRRHQDLGRDAAGLDVLRTQCAAVFADALPSAPPVPVAKTILVNAFRFRLFADVIPALNRIRAAGIRLGVVSNWDVSLTGVLEECGILDEFAAVSASAVVGVRKPDPAIFLHALDQLSVDAADAVHVGDDPVLDVEGARAAGICAVRIDRGKVGTPGSVADLAAFTNRLALGG
jgi:FMN phosphatase YigB (HAD superfamily)